MLSDETVNDDRLRMIVDAPVTEWERKLARELLAIRERAADMDILGSVVLANQDDPVAAVARQVAYGDLAEVVAQTDLTGRAGTAVYADQEIDHAMSNLQRIIVGADGHGAPATKPAPGVADVVRLHEHHARMMMPQRLPMDPAADKLVEAWVAEQPQPGRQRLYSEEEVKDMLFEYHPPAEVEDMLRRLRGDGGA